jgi:hypothetical protein
MDPIIEEEDRKFNDLDFLRLSRDNSSLDWNIRTPPTMNNFRD